MAGQAYQVGQFVKIREVDGRITLAYVERIVAKTGVIGAVPCMPAPAVRPGAAFRPQRVRVREGGRLRAVLHPLAEGETAAMVAAVEAQNRRLHDTEGRAAREQEAARLARLMELYNANRLTWQTAQMHSVRLPDGTLLPARTFAYAGAHGLTLLVTAVVTSTTEYDQDARAQAPTTRIDAAVLALHPERLPRGGVITRTECHAKELAVGALFESLNAWY